MGKREDVKRPKLPRDFYPTVDIDAVLALAPHVQPFTRDLVGYIEPCGGGGHLIDLLASVVPSLQCVAAYDIQPEDSRVGKKDCLTLTQSDCVGARVFITNPPFDWGMLKPILDHLPTLLPTWLLLPADLMHNKRMSPYMGYCTDVVSVGRLWWFKDENYKKVKGVDNFCWYKFCDPKDAWGFRIQFHGRVL